jgi:hypothetical protein
LIVFAEEAHPWLRGPGTISMFDAANRLVDFDLSTNRLCVDALCVDDFELSGVAFQQHHPLGDKHLPHHRQEDGTEDEFQVNGGIDDIAEFKEGNNIGSGSATPDRGAKTLLGCRIGLLGWFSFADSVHWRSDTW